MTHSLHRPLVLLAAVCGLTLFAVDASASVRVRCETRSDRSKASVDGNNLASGRYTARIESGPNSADSRKAQRTRGDEVEFDFDSNTGEGGTRIPRDFIVGNQLTGMILDMDGNVVEIDTVNCRRR